MEINYEDHALIKNYVLSYLENSNNFIELLFNYAKCGQNNQDINNNFSQQLNNIKILIKYFKNNNIIIGGWRLNSTNDLFENNNLFQILDILYDYFDYIKKPGIIIYPNNYLFFNNSFNIEQIKKYIENFSLHQIKIMLPCQLSFNNCNNNEQIFDFILKYQQDLNLLVNDNLEKYLEYYLYWKNVIINKIQKLPNFIINKTIIWNEDNMSYLQELIKYMIKDRLSYFNYDEEKLTQHLLFSNKYLDKYNTLFSSKQDDLLKIIYYDKIGNNCLSCKLNSVLTIDCNNLSFPACCGLSHNVFNGGKFLIENNQIIDIVANEGLNGFLNQKFTNVHFMLDCYTCRNKYFCAKGCRAAQFEYSTEPFLPIPNICLVYNTILETLINEYHKLGIFDYYLTQNIEPLEETYKHELIKLLKEKGYPEYEFKYSE